MSAWREGDGPAEVMKPEVRDLLRTMLRRDLERGTAADDATELRWRAADAIDEFLRSLERMGWSPLDPEVLDALTRARVLLMSDEPGRWPTPVGGERGFVRSKSAIADNDLLVDVLYPAEARRADDPKKDRTERKNARDRLRKRVQNHLDR